jgi:histidinol-phosphate/aromatic aminotransferase/cobyric acid decarboxylase-like protein
VVDKYSATELARRLLWEDEIYIKDLTGKFGFENKEYIRVAVRDYSDNEFLIKRLKEL